MKTFKQLLLDNTYFHLGQDINKNGTLKARTPSFKELVTHANLYLLARGLSPQQNFLVRGLSFIALLPVGIFSLFILPFTGVHINMTYSLQSLLYVAGKKVGDLIKEMSPENALNEMDLSGEYKRFTTALNNSDPVGVKNSLKSIQEELENQNLKPNAYIAKHIKAKPISASDIQGCNYSDVQTQVEEHMRNTDSFEDLDTLDKLIAKNQFTT